MRRYFASRRKCGAVSFSMRTYLQEALALLDLRLHIRYGEDRYPTPESVWSVWNQKLGGAFDHLVPLPSETLRVAALPGQALGYIMPDVCPKEGCRGCHSQCTAASSR